MEEIIVSRQVYYEIVERFEHTFDNSDSDLFPLKTLESEIISKYSLPQRTVASIISINYVKRIKHCNYRLMRIAPKLWDRYKAAVANNESIGIIMRLSKKNGASPALVAKLLLDQYKIENKSQKEDKVQANESKKVKNESKNMASKLMRDTSLIKDGRLAKEILMSIYYDDQYGPISEMYHRSIGEEYERLLYKKAKECRLSYQSECDLRNKGYDKTPDLKLNVPIAVDGFIINWIESKGLFGDEAGHRKYTLAQYSSYWNRFGPGLVIYWLGYEETIAGDNSQEKRFIVRSTFPENITYMSPLLTTQ